MPYKIIEFKSLEEAISILNKFGNEFSFPRDKLSKNEIVRNSVASNIFRAFRNLEVGPSIIYRQWASDNFDTIVTELASVSSHTDYYKYIEKWGDSLIQRWMEETLIPDNYLMYGPALKMVNLLIKWIQISEAHRQPDKIKYQQVPFDSFSLKPIRPIINELTGLSYKIIIPTNASMAFVNTPQMYTILMDSIYKLTKLAKISPIVYDYWCWEDKHRKH